MKFAFAAMWLLLFPLFLTLFPTQMLENVPSALQEIDAQEVQGRAQTTWSGTQTLSGTYTISVTDEVIIQPCTVVQLPANERLIVEGRLTVLGTTTCPVIFRASGLGDHEGIQFNASSSGRGSFIQNLTIQNAIYGVTIYGSNPIIENLTVVNPDRVAVDLFNYAAPRITDLYVNRAGRELPFQSDWRFGLGLSVGAGSTPIVKRAVFHDILTRAINFWGGSGGLIQGITIDNCSGSSWTMVAGIWVEDSQPLLTNISIDTSDSGIVIRHINDGGYTHAVIRNTFINNSMYRGVYVDKNNHTNYTNYETADFTNLTVLGTGGQGAKTPNIGYAAIEVNATGAWFDDTLVADSTTVGVRLYFVDSTTTFRNLTIRDSGDPGQGPHEAGLAVRSSYFAPRFEGMEISGSVGPGVYSSSGGAMEGFDWVLHNNTKHGLFVDSATVELHGLKLADNGQSGAQIWNARYVFLENLTAERNGGDALSNPLARNQAGLYFEESNDIESASGDVRCRNCLIRESTGAGIYALNSVDLWLENITLEDNNPTIPTLEIDNSANMPNGAVGRVYMQGISANAESPGVHAVYLNRVAALVDDLQTPGNHSGVYWRGDNNANLDSELSASEFSGTGCLELVNHPGLYGVGNHITNGCTGEIILLNSQVNWSNIVDDEGLSPTPHVLNLDATSSLHLHQPRDISLSSASIASGATIDVAWDIMVWVINNYSNGIPNANVNVSFASYEPSVQMKSSELGYVFLPDFVGQRWTSAGASVYNNFSIACGYDSVSNSSTAVLDQDHIISCVLELDNQPPFLRWQSPTNLAVFPSGGEVLFNASGSWDLDNDPLIFTWTSSIDGDILSGCSGSWPPSNGPAQGFAFIANGNDTYLCTLSDGIHQITLEICDGLGAGAHCVSATRSIELVNLDPVLVVAFTPGLNPWSELIMPQTGTLSMNTTGTYDPEGDDIACKISFIGYTRASPVWNNQWQCPEVLTWTFDHTEDDPPAVFQLEVSVWDIVGNDATFTVDVMLFNEIPTPQFTISRDTNTSESLITLDATSTIDPEGDGLTFTYSSSIDGVLGVGGPVWQGYLSRGVHTITLRVGDDQAEHVNQSKSTSQMIVVENSLPKSVIATPQSQTFDSSELIAFSANGSGDFDAACASFPEEGDWVCAPFEPSAGTEYLVVTWSSDLDGRLTPEGEDWLWFEHRLSAGEHIITLSVDDGIHEPVVATREVTIIPSAPVMGLVSPVPSTQYLSSAELIFDVSQSIDYDGDAFDVTLRSSLENEPLLINVDPFTPHDISLVAGQHLMTVTLTDVTGLSRDEYFSLTILESAPVLRILSPENRQSIEAGLPLVLEEASYDADNDLVVREWRHWTADKSFPQILSTSSKDEIFGLPPGEYHLSLYIEDSRGNWVEQHLNITLQSSLPELDRDSLVLSSDTFVAGELATLSVRIFLSDPDGTTKDVRMNITHNIQQWEVNLSDADGDGTWDCVLEWRPEAAGRPLLKIIARDGSGDNVNIDIVSRNLVVEEPASDDRIVVLGLSVVGVLGAGFLFAWFVQRRKRATEEIDLLTSWDAFRAPAPKAETKVVPSLESEVMDGTDEVLAQLDDLI